VIASRLLDVAARLLPSEAEPSAATVRPGDVRTLELSATVEGPGQVAWPTAEELHAALQGRAAVLAGPTDAPAAPGAADLGGTTHARRYELQLLLAPGTRELGPLDLVLRDAVGEEADRATVPPVSVEVASVLEPAAEEALRQAQQEPQQLQQAILQHVAPPRGPWVLEGPGLPWWAWACLAGALLLAAVTAWWAWRRRRGPGAASVPAVPAEPPEAVARRRLQALLAARHLERGEHRIFHVELADILKTYLDGRHGWDLRERTTDEIRALLRHDLRFRPLAAAIAREIVGTLEGCDLVKFARHAPPPADSLALAEAVSQVIERTAPRPPMEGAA
jgi:hypothetical protein